MYFFFLFSYLFSIFLQLQGPSVSGLPINPPGSQVTKSAEQPGLTRAHKQPVRQVSSLVGPSLRNPAGVQDGTKSAAKVGLQSREPKAKSAAIKQTKISAWRQADIDYFIYFLTCQYGLWSKANIAFIL